MILLYTLAALAVLNTLFAFIGGAAVSYPIAALGVVAAVYATLRMLPGPTKGWRSPSGAISMAHRPMPGWAVLVAAVALFGGLAAELGILALVWGAR